MKFLSIQNKTGGFQPPVFSEKLKVNSEKLWRPLCGQIFKIVAVRRLQNY